MKKLLSIQEASEIIGLKVSTIYKYICCRRIPYIKIGQRVFFSVEKLESWINDKSVDPIESVVPNKKGKIIKDFSRADAMHYK